MLKKIIAGIAGLTFAFSVVVSSGTLQTKAMETTTETTAEETTDTDGSEVPRPYVFWMNRRMMKCIFPALHFKSRWTRQEK